MHVGFADRQKVRGNKCDCSTSVWGEISYTPGAPVISFHSPPNPNTAPVQNTQSYMCIHVTVITLFLLCYSYCCVFYSQVIVLNVGGFLYGSSLITFSCIIFIAGAIRCSLFCLMILEWTLAHVGLQGPPCWW